ncbi:MAG: hypothetical protein AB7G13_02645 [Lautropia sp.]
MIRIGESSGHAAGVGVPAPAAATAARWPATAGAAVAAASAGGHDVDALGDLADAAAPAIAIHSTPAADARGLGIDAHAARVLGHLRAGD